MHAAYRIGVLLALANARSYAARRHRLRKRNKTLRSKSAHEFIYATCRIGKVVMACGRSYAARRLCNTATTIALTPSDQLAMERCHEDAQL